MEPSSSRKKQFANCHMGKKHLIMKVNKCIQVDMDLEEESLREIKSCPDAICLSEIRTESFPGAPRTSENLRSFQLGTTPLTPRKCPPPPLLPLPPLPNSEKITPSPPLLVPGERVSPPRSQLLCKNGEYPVYGPAGIPCPQKGMRPTLRMKPFNWQTLPLDVVTGGHSLWASVAAGGDQTIEPDYASIEQQFCIPQTSHRERTKPTREKLKEVSFVDPVKSLHLNIVLKQFKCSNEQIVDMIQKGDRTKFDAEALKQLIKLLPENKETESLTNFKGKKAKLANADRFYLGLLGIPSYRLRIECLLICAEASVVMDLLWPKAKLVKAACETLLTNPRLPVFCQLILKVGNFLNYGRHTGNASGFKIGALLKLTETRANHARITLLHHILEEVEKNHRDLLQLPDDFECVSKAAGINFQDMKREADILLKKLLETEHKISLSESDVKVQFGKSIKGCINASKELDEEMKALLKKKAELADYLCEDRNTQFLEDVFNTMKTFRSLFSKALKENQDRRNQVATAEKRKPLFGKEEAKRPKYN